MWLSGYMLEWMLSFDNLFVFHMIFSVYQTPDHLKHRPVAAPCANAELIASGGRLGRSSTEVDEGRGRAHRPNGGVCS